MDSWLKVKKDYSASMDTLDLIPIGGWHGQGRKSAWWSPILLACRNPEDGRLEAVTKCMSGFTDAFYKANKAKYDDEDEENANVVARPSYVDYFGTPDVWFEPQEGLFFYHIPSVCVFRPMLTSPLVWEIQFADITLSPTYTAAIGLVDPDRGLSTRFPRFLKVREDKSIEEASTSDFLASLWRKQEARVRAEVEGGGAAAKGKGSKATKDDEDGDEGEVEEMDG